MEKIILFNENLEYYEFAYTSDAADFLDVDTQDIVEKDEINGYYIEKEQDRIVQYNRHIPVRIWDSIREVADKLLIHERVIAKSLNKNCIEQIHFKWMSHTKGKPFYG